jgi:cyclophilin family peptidyl-prolyl cis-trans isomerase
MHNRTVILSLSLMLTFLLQLNATSQIEVGAVPQTVRETCKLSDFYQQGTEVEGLPIVSSDKVSPFALQEAAWILRNLLDGREEILRTMAQRGAFVMVMAHNEYTTDVPEHSHLTPRIYWDRRARGLGGIPVSCGEENLLCFPNDPYAKENLLIHEFAHGMHSQAIKLLYPTFQGRLEAAYERARSAGLWEGTYAITNAGEYWAEAVQSWCDDNRENDALHNHVNTRAELKAYDPPLAQLCTEVLGDGPWRYRKPWERHARERTHLAGYDSRQRPTFKWREETLTDRPVVRIRTALGAIEIELDAKMAPKSATNFLRYVHEGFYNDGHFFRTVRADNQPDNPVKIAVIQAQADPNHESEAYVPISLERTRDTRLKHLDGTLSMARMGPDTATHHFFICVGDQPELDFGGQRNPDGQGFAAFGHVVKGMDIVRQMHQLPAKGQQLSPPVRIQRAIRLE